MSLAASWDAITIRNTHDTLSNPQNDMIIVDTAADQCTVTEKSWKIEDKTGRFINCGNYLDSNNVSCPVVTATTIVHGPNLPPTLVQVNEAVLIPGEHKNESLLHARNCKIYEFRNSKF